MPRRTLITASLLLLILALLALLPALPAVREYALDRVAGVLSDADVELTYGSSSGNLWRGVTLEDVAIEGAGSDVTIDRVRVGYFLPSLLGGELPLDIAVVGADGDLDLGELLGEFVTAPSGPQSRSLSLRLRRLDLRDIEVDVAQLPFSLPDAGLRTLDVVQDGTNLLLSGDIVTPDGDAALKGRYESLSGTIYITVENGDATIARHWWDGITAGQVSGELQIRGPNIEGDFVISDAAVDDVGLRAENVSGTATLRYPVISADLSGTAFGGPLAATGVVNIEARRWEVNGVAQPTLAAAAAWLARSQFPSGLPVDISGNAAVNLSIAGWNKMTLEGSASGSGAVEGVPLEGLNATFRIPSDGIVRAEADATLGGGPVEVTMGPSAGAERLTISAQGVGLETIQAGLGEIDADLDLQLGPDGSGSLRADWQGELAGTATRAMLDATLDPDGWQGFIRAEDDAGLVAEGALVLNDGRLQGSLTSDQLGRDLLTPGARVALAVDGNLGGGGSSVSDGGVGADGSPGGQAGGIGVTLSIDGADSAAGSLGSGASQPVSITALPPAIAEGLAGGLDLAGSVTGVLDLSGANGPVLRDLTGSFGPLDVSGNVALSPLRAELGISSSAISFSTEASASSDADGQAVGQPAGQAANEAAAGGPGDAAAEPATAITTTIAVPASTLLVDADGVSWNGTIEHGGVAVGPLALQPGVLDALFALPTGGSWRLTANSRSGDLVVTADPGDFAAELNGLPLQLGEDSLAVSGSLDGNLAADGSEEGNTAATSIALDLVIAAGDASQGSTSRLPAPVSVTGGVDLGASRADLRGELLNPRPLPYEAQISWGEAAPNGLSASITLPASDQDDPLRADYLASGEGAAGRFSLQGTAALSAFTPAAEGSVTAAITGAVSGQGLSDLAGGLRIATTRPTPVVAELSGNGSTIDIEIEGVTFGGGDQANASAAQTPAADAPAAPATADNAGLLSASGTIDVSSFADLLSSDEALITADIGPLEGVAIGLRGATGSGTLEPLALGPLTVPPTPWELTASWGQGAAPAFTLSLAAEPLRFTLSGDDLVLAGGVSIPVGYAGEEFVLAASVPGGVIDLNEIGATPLAATLTHLGDSRAPEGDASPAPLAAGEVLTIAGTLAGLELNGSLPTALLMPQLPSSNRPEGRLTVEGTVAPLDGPSYQAAVELTAELPPAARAALPGEAGAEAEPVSLSGTVSGSGAAVTAHLSGAGLTFDLRDRALAVTANDTDLRPLLGIAGNIDGSLSLDTESRWAGDLSVSATLGLDDAAAGSDADGESLVANLDLQGAGDTLRANVVVTGPLESRLTAAGTLSPTMNLTGELNAAGGILLGDLSYGTDSGLVVDLTSQELLVDEYIEVPALAAKITMAPGEPLRLVGSGEALRADVVAQLAGSSDTLSGRITLPFTMLSEPAELAIELSGSLTQPWFVAAVRGEGLRVDAVGDLQSAEAAIEVDPSVAAVLAPAAGVATQLVTEPVRAEAAWVNGEGWSLTAAATAFGAEALAAEVVEVVEDIEEVEDVQAGDSDQLVNNEVTLLLSLTGDGDSYTGELSAYLPTNPAQPLAIATVEGSGADLVAELDLGSVAWTRVGTLLSVDMAITGSGTASFATNPVTAALQLDLSGQVEGLQVELSGTAPNDIDLSLSSADVDLTAEIAWNEERKAVLQGTIRGRPVDGWLELADDLRSGLVSLEAPGANVEAVLSTSDDPAGTSPTRQLEVNANLSGELLGADTSSQGSAAGQPATQSLSADLTALVTLSGDRAELASFNANVTGLPTGQTVELTASGPLTPTTDVTGSIYAPALDERAELYIAKPNADEGLSAGLRWQELDLGYSLAEGRFSLSGSADLSEQLAPLLAERLAPSVNIAEADLHWSPVAGFVGGFVIRLDAAVLSDYGITTPITVTAAAGGPDAGEIDAADPAPLVLTFAAAATPPNLAGATAEAEASIVIAGPLTSPSDLTLDGELQLGARVPAQDQHLAVRADVSGTILAPVIGGTVSADGPLAATGTLDYAAGRGSLNAQGPHLDVNGELAGGEWSAQALLDGLPIERWLPQLADPRLSLNASASSGATSGTPDESVAGADGDVGSAGSFGATVDGLLLEARNTRLSGAATIAGGVRVALQAHVDLADLRLEGASFTGLLRGPLVLTAPAIAELADANVTAQLDASEVGLAAVDETLSGSLTVGGKVSDPTLGALLVGNGGLTGALRVNATPARGRFELTSSLAGAGFSTSLQVGVNEDLVMATGQARYQDAVVLLADAPSGIELSGAGRLEGWRASIAPDLATVAASGPLSAVSPAIAGDLDLVITSGTGNAAGADGEDSASAASTPDTAWLAASITDLSVGGAALGDLDLSSAEPGAEVLVTGDGITASLTPADLSWSLEVADFSLPGEVSVAVAGAGVGAAGAISGSVTRATDDSPLGVDLDFTLSNSVGEEAATTVTVDGSVLGGTLTANGSRGGSGAWSGGLRLSGAAVSGFGLSATGVLQGQGLIPQAVLATALVGEGERPIAIVGRVSAGGNGVSFDQSAALPQLGSPLRLQGSLSPDLDLVLSGAATRSSGAADGERPAAAVGAARFYATGGGLRASGEVTLPLGPVDVIFDGNGPESSPRVEVRLAAARNVAVEADLSATDLAGLVAKIGSEGLVFEGIDAATGVLNVSLSPTLQMQLEDFGAELGGFALALSGELSGSGAELDGALRLPLDLPVGAQTAGSDLPLRVTGADGRWFVESTGDLGSLAAEFDASDSRVVVDVDLALPTAAADSEPVEGLDQGIRSGAVVGRITYDPINGPAGTLALANVTLAPSGIGELTLNADTAIADGRLGGSATLDTAGGRVTINGATRLAEFFPALPGPEPVGRDVSNLELRVRTLQLDEFPAVANVAPHLSGALSGVVQLRNGFMLGQLLAPDLAIGGEPVPLELQLTGPPSNLDAAMQFAGSLFTADLGSGRIAGSSRLERFPLDLLGEAFVGPTDVQAYVTGVLRFDLPSTDPVAGYVRLATEEITLERAGVRTTGRVALSYEDRHLNVQQAEFGGEGSWSAQGVLGPELLDFTLEANDADFSPLLGLVPALSRFAVGAAGSFTFSAQGDFSAPQVSLISDNLDVSLAGTRFRIEDTDVILSGTELSASTTVRGLDPLEGAIAIDGGATVMLAPLALRSVDFGFTGDLEVPGLGLVDDISGSIRQNADNLPTLFMTGMLGQPLTVQGTLVPLDLRATGSGLEVSLPTLLIADSTLAVDVALNSEEGGVVVGGAIQASEVVIDPAARAAADSTPADAADGAAATADPAAVAEATDPAAETSDEPGATEATDPAAEATDPTAEATDGPGAGDEELDPGSESLSELPAIRPAIEQLESVDDSSLVSTATVAEAQAQGALNARAAVRFDDVRITAPQRVLMSMSIASLEASVDLTLAGTAADPRLAGEARALRGSLRFAGREFTVDRAVASFSPNRGVLPELDVAAHAEFEKSRVLTGATDVEFVAPSDGNTFTVDLAFAGPMEIDEEDGGISFDIVPVLSSDALVEISGEGVGAGVRPLSEAELLSLITLGRIEFGSDLIGAGGLGGAVAQGALDTAVDLLVVGELQNALREALGLDVVEIRTTAFSSLLGGEGSQPFGVSVRLGGYLNPELFASYRIGTTDPNDPGYGFTNEVALRYALGPLNLDILGRLDFPVAGSLNDPRPELGVGVSYDFGRALSIDTGVTLSSQRQVVSFGVALRW